MITRRRLSMLALVPWLVACGTATSTGSPLVPSSPPDSSASTATPSLVTGSFVADDPRGSWVLASPPTGMLPSFAGEDEGRREISYGTSTADLYDSPVRVVVTDPDRNESARYDDAVDVDVNGHAAYLQEMQSDGSVFGSEVIWVDELGRTVSVEWTEVGHDVLALARQMVAVNATQWSLLLRSLAIDTQIGMPTPDATEAVLVDVGTGVNRYRLVALVPADYPLAEVDRRRTCYRLDLGDTIGAAHCDGHPWWARSATDVFVYGPAPAGVKMVSVRKYDGLSATAEPSTDGTADAPVVTAPVLTTAGPPGGLYVAIAPVDWCFTAVSAAVDGDSEGELLGPGSPLPMQPEHAGCIAGT